MMVLMISNWKRFEETGVKAFPLWLFSISFFTWPMMEGTIRPVANGRDSTIWWIICVNHDDKNLWNAKEEKGRKIFSQHFYLKRHISVDGGGPSCSSFHTHRYLEKEEERLSCSVSCGDVKPVHRFLSTGKEKRSPYILSCVRGVLHLHGKVAEFTAKLTGHGRSGQRIDLYKFKKIRWTTCNDDARFLKVFKTSINLRHLIVSCWAI